MEPLLLNAPAAERTAGTHEMRQVVKSLLADEDDSPTSSRWARSRFGGPGEAAVSDLCEMLGAR